MHAREGLTWQEMTVGLQLTTASRTVNDIDIVNFVSYCGFAEPLFLDMEYVRNETPYEGRLAPGLLTLALAEGLVIQSGMFHSTGLALLGIDFSMRGPVVSGDTIHVVVEVTASRPTKNPERGIVTTKNSVMNQRGDVVVEYAPVRMIRGASPERPDA